MPPFPPIPRLRKSPARPMMTGFDVVCGEMPFPRETVGHPYPNYPPHKESFMNSIKGSQTEQNLLKSFAGESQARNRYTYAAGVAKKEGFVQIADIFTETADQEREHAKHID